MANFDAAALALKAVCPTNDLLYDDKGLPSVMVYIPKFKLSDVIAGASDSTHPAFIVNGTEIDGFWVSKYQNIMQDSRAYSLPCEDPKASINFDTARTYCENKGDGWHCMTRAEWAAIALWCLNNGFQPKGNNRYGRDDSDSTYDGIPMTYGTGADAGKIYHIATGSGPISYSHNNALSGIWDLNGNVNEWQGGIRLVKGEIQVLVNNNAADADNSQAAASAQWKAINAAATGSNDLYLTPNGSGTTSGSVKLDYVSNHWQWDTTISSQDDSSRSATFASTTCSGNISATAKELLYALCLMPASSTATDYSGDYFYANNGADERAFYAGGSYSTGANAGVFYLSVNARSGTNPTVGFRSAYVDLPSA